ASESPGARRQQRYREDRGGWSAWPRIEQPVDHRQARETRRHALARPSRAGRRSSTAGDWGGLLALLGGGLLGLGLRLCLRDRGLRLAFGLRKRSLRLAGDRLHLAL